MQATLITKKASFKVIAEEIKVEVFNVARLQRLPKRPMKMSRSFPKVQILNMTYRGFPLS